MTTLFEMYDVVVEKNATLYEKFLAFHEANPKVYQRLYELSMQMKARGHKKIGIAMLFERMRWEWYEKTTDVSGYKLNNNHKAYYARLLMESPELVGFFDVRSIGDM